MNVKDEIERILDIHYTENEKQEWLNLPHPQLDGKKPAELIEAGQETVVLQVLERLDSGAYI